MRALIAFLLLAACGSEDATYMIVTVDKRASVHDAKKLHITLANAGSERSDDLDLKDHMFPVTFSLSAPGRSGPLEIRVDALDGMGALVGRGASTTTLDATGAMVLLDGADFVVNTTYANSQFLTTDFEAVGLQLAAITGGTWTAAFRDDCTSCDMFARRFDANGTPVQSALAAGTSEFTVNDTNNKTTSTSFPAVAAAGTTTLVLWDYFDTTAGTQGVACRAINDQGAAVSGQLEISSDTPDVVTATGMPNGNFIVTWQTFMTNYVIRGVVVKPDCTLLGAAPATISNSGTLTAHRSHVAANGINVLYAWIVNGEVRVRPGLNSGAFSAAESTIIAPAGGLQVDHVRVSPWGTGFAVAARWASSTATGPGKIEVYRTNAAGMVMGKPILITDASGSDFPSDKAFGIARRPDDALLVVWHACETGPGSCDVFGRILRPTGAPVGDPFVIPTSTGGDQINPSVIALQDSFVAAWNDSSGQEPDKSGSAVRARVIFPTYDDARGIQGATCGPSSPGSPDCNDGLACAMGSDGVSRCYVKCTPPNCPSGGSCTSALDGSSACTY